jgi:hypothetical protein
MTTAPIAFRKVRRTLHASLRRPIAEFAGGVAALKAEGATEVEVKERKDRVDDALHLADQGSQVGGGLVARPFFAKGFRQFAYLATVEFRHVWVHVRLLETGDVQPCLDLRLLAFQLREARLHGKRWKHPTWTGCQARLAT